MAVVMLGAVHRIVFGAWLPDIDQTGMIYLAISGLVGLAIGDQLLFTALVDIGPRLSTLLMTCAPPIAAILAWPVLDEPLGWMAMLGIAVTLAGIIWVVNERPDPRRPSRIKRNPAHRFRGVIFGFLAAACQAIGLILAKVGIGHTRLPVEEHYGTWSVTFTRMLFGLGGMVVIFAILRLRYRWRDVDRAMYVSPEREHLPESEPTPAKSVWPAALLFTTIGAVFGPVLGVWLSMVAVDRAAAGVAATLMAMSPVFILPLAAWIEHERITWRAAVGAGIAVGGVILLTLADRNGGESPPVDTVEAIADPNAG